MSKWMQQAMMAGAALALIGTTACSTLEASNGYGAGDGTAQSQDDVLQHMAADSQGG